MSSPQLGIVLAADLPASLRSAIADALAPQQSHITVEQSAEINELRPDSDVFAVPPELCKRPELRELLDLERSRERPAVVVLDAAPTPQGCVELLGEGVDRIIDPMMPPGRIAAVLRAVGERHRNQRTAGPEIRGQVVEPRLTDFLSFDLDMQRFVALAERVVDAEASLLITGETGVGKERLARALHSEGPRSDRRFLSVNCGALPESLLESQLFGYERGAFTGATERHPGFFEQAEHGTLFLDEIGEMPPHLQVKLLSVLQRHEVQRLGAERTAQVDVRVMAATNADLFEAVEAGRFREDLFFRLNVVHLALPPLRERLSDVPHLVGEMLRFFRNELPNSPVRRISRAALDRMMRYDWPGNVRELVNAVERAMLLAESEEIRENDLPATVREGTLQSRPLSSPEENAARDEGTRDSGETLLPDDWQRHSLRELREQFVEDFERSYLDAALRSTSGSIAKTAKLAGIGPRSLYDKMRRLDLRKEDYRAPVRR